MKSVARLILFGLFLSVVMLVCAQTLSSNEMKAVKKEVKKYEKEGWKTLPGTLSLQEQLIRSRKVQQEEDGEGCPKWHIGVASSIGRFYDAARMRAMTSAKAELTGMVTKCLTGKYVANSENQQMPLDQAESLAKAAIKIKAVSVGQRIGNPLVIFDAFRKLPNGNYEVTLSVAILVRDIDNIADELFLTTRNNK
jgi:hypothetical protein